MPNTNIDEHSLMLLTLILVSAQFVREDPELREKLMSWSEKNLTAGIPAESDNELETMMDHAIKHWVIIKIRLMRQVYPERYN